MFAVLLFSQSISAISCVIVASALTPVVELTSPEACAPPFTLAVYPLFSASVSFTVILSLAANPSIVILELLVTSLRVKIETP